MSKYAYKLEAFTYDSWYRVVEGPLLYCQGYMAARREGSSPHLAYRLIRSDGKIIDEFKADDEVGIGQVAGWPTAEQYEAAAKRALDRAKAIRVRDSERAKGDAIVQQLDRCRHCGGKAVMRIEPTPPPHPNDTHTGDWTPDRKSVRVECAACHIQTNSVPEDMFYLVVRRWNGN